MKTKLTHEYYTKRMLKTRSFGEFLKECSMYSSFLQARVDYARQMYAEGVLEMNPNKLAESMKAFA